jgi:hypothetical protein
MSYEQSFYQAIDGSRIRISDSSLCGGAEYRYPENSILLFIPLSHSDGEKVTIKYKGKNISVPIDELISETIGHEFLHMLLFWFIDRMTSKYLDRIDDKLRVDFYDKFLGLCESTGRKT